ncbi:MAG: hypothetical protein HYV78_01580, partial [Candidatus Wildermuthbacteria bacterium]|nr:hypothetical protein [Candidatus Wildermuthbacteria bacterium]
MSKRFPSFLIIFVLLFIGAAFWLWQRNAYSKDTLKLEILGKEQAVAGEEITYTVKYKNNGTARLERSTLVFEFPSETVPSEGNQPRNTKEIGDVYPGQEASVQFKGRLFGKEGDLKEAKAWMIYSPKNLNAVYQSDTGFLTTLSLVPLTIDLDIPSFVENAQRFSFQLNYFSRSDYPLANLLVKMEYPQGFLFKESNPPSFTGNEWTIGQLAKAQGGRIAISGSLQGQLQDLKTFKAVIGTWKEGAFTVLREVSKDVEIANPNIQISQRVNGSDEIAAVSPGDVLRYEILYKNVSDNALENLSLSVQLQGKAFDIASVQAVQGALQKETNSIMWNSENVSSLRRLGRGQEATAEFSVAVKDPVPLSSPLDKNLALKTIVSLSDIQKEYELKLNSKLHIQQQGYFQDEVFGNEGPLPPRAGNKTTYTITWKASNATNDQTNVKVKAVLPAEVELTGKIFPADASLTFDSKSREIVWTIGPMKAGAGKFSAPSSVAFQIALTPKDYQKGKPALLVGEAIITGEDAFTKQTLASQDESIDTTLTDDRTV